VRIRSIDGPAFSLLIAGAVALAGLAWLRAHPQDNPWAPLDLRDPPGWATRMKLAGLRTDPAECRAVLARSGVAFTALDPAGRGACRRDDRILLPRLPLAPEQPQVTCALGAGLDLWFRREVQPAATALLGSRVERIEHYGAYSCRRLYGRDAGAWSEHATGNAIDVAAFVLADGRRITVRGDWRGDGPRARFLHRVREGACRIFGTVLSPDYNAAHRDHLHLDQAARGWGGFCR
jgi:hypothetical protein